MNCSLENVSLSESNREISVHVAGCCKRKVKKRPISYCHKFFVGDSFTSKIPDFSCMQILSRGRLTGLSVDLENAWLFQSLILGKYLHAGLCRVVNF